MKSMRNLFSGVLEMHARGRYLWTLSMATLLVFMSSQPAYAEINGCTTTRGVGRFVDLVWDSIVNPIRAYGWLIVAAAFLLALLASAVNKGGSFWKAVLWLVVLMAVGLALAAQIKGPGTGIC